MFHSARLKVTVWYLLIIMIISIAFSTFIYFGATAEFDRILRVQKFRLEHPNLQIIGPYGTQVEITPPSIDPELIAEVKFRVLMGLIGVNIIILFISSLAGYFLAGRTLKPIQEMVDEQNRFITDASHELRTPLTALKSEIEVFLRSKKHNLKESEELLKSNLEEVNTLQLLSDNLLQLAQYQKPHETIIRHRISLTDVISSAIKKVQPLAKSKQIIIQEKINPQTLFGDLQQLIQLFVILLDNAIKYSYKHSTINIISQKNDHTVLVEVKDNGVGIDTKDLPHIFDRFFRADTSRTKQEINGYGLGLAIAKTIVQLHKGTINVNSEKGKGTTFAVELPVHR